MSYWLVKYFSAKMLKLNSFLLILPIWSLRLYRSCLRMGPNVWDEPTLICCVSWGKAVARTVIFKTLWILSHLWEVELFCLVQPMVAEESTTVLLDSDLCLGTEPSHYSLHLLFFCMPTINICIACNECCVTFFFFFSSPNWFELSRCSLSKIKSHRFSTLQHQAETIGIL